MIVLPTFAGLKATYNVLDLKITKKREVERKYIQKTTWCCCCFSHLSCKQGFATTLQNDQKGCGTNFFIIMYGDEW